MIRLEDGSALRSTNGTTISKHMINSLRHSGWLDCREEEFTISTAGLLMMNEREHRTNQLGRKHANRP